NKDSGVFTRFPNGGDVVYQDSSGLIYCVASFNTVNILDPTTSSLKSIPLPLPDNRRSSTCALLAVEDHFLIATRRDLLKMHRNGGLEILYQRPLSEQAFFNDMWIDPTGNLWLPSSPGVAVIDPSDQHIQFFSLEQFNSPNRIYPGRIAYHEARQEVYLSHVSPHSHRRLYLIARPGHPQGSQEISLDVQPVGIAVDKQGTTWVAADGKLYTKTETHQLLDRSGDLRFTTEWLWNMRTGAHGLIGGAGEDGFFWFDPATMQGSELRIEELPVWEGVGEYLRILAGFKFSRDGRKAYLVSAALHEVDLMTGVARLLRFEPSFGTDGQHLLDVEEGLDGHLWISSFRQVGKFARAGDSLIMVERYLVRDGLASSEVHELHCDQTGRIWLFTTNGINAIDPGTREIRYFGTNQGLPQVFIDPRQIIETSKGEIITVNSNGIIIYHPDSLWHSLSPESVPVALKAIRVNGQEIGSEVNVCYLEQIRVPMGKNVVDIAFQGLAYPRDELVRYSYRLDPDQPWIDIGSNKLVTLPDMKPGRYSFQVKAAAPSSQAPITSLVIHVPTPLYQQVWFIIGVLVVMGLIIYLWYRSRIRRIRREEAEKTRINKRFAELELKALRSQMNPHFMFNSLNSIKDYILHAQPEKAAEYLSDFAHLIRMILQHSREKTVTLHQELETLMLYIELEQMRFEHSFDFNCIVDDGIDMHDVHIPPMLLQPYIENAIWHGLMHKEGQGLLILEFRRQGTSVLCIVDDNGVGRQRAAELKSLSATRYKSMGMGITRDRIEIMNRMDSLGISVEIEDKQDADGNANGTRVTLTSPLQDEIPDP
ncbi:MAG: histidine kinase, partial [Saprospiraceae bacterium]|nr:histidine kinase [Saprospiraceae bacterium]